MATRKTDTAIYALVMAAIVGIILAGSCGKLHAATDDHRLDIARPLLVYGLSSGSDSWESHRALSRCPGCRERNLMGPTLGPAVSGAAMLSADLILQKTGHRREARILRWVYAGACTVFVVKAVTVKDGRPK